MEIIKVYSQILPASRFIGVKYGREDSDNGSYSAKWGEAFETGLFDKIEAARGENRLPLYEDDDAYIGLMSWDGAEYAYWIGEFAAPGTLPPEGMGYVDFPECKLGVGWAYGVENELYAGEDAVIEKIKLSGLNPKTDENGASWYFERYQCPRFTSPDDKGNVILDIGFIAE